MPACPLSLLDGKQAFAITALFLCTVLSFFPKTSKSYKCTTAILSIFFIGLYFISDRTIISLSAHMIDFLYVLNIAAAFLIIALLSSFFRSSVDRMIDHLNETNEKLNIMASTDSLTGIAHFLFRLRSAWLNGGSEKKLNT